MEATEREAASRDAPKITDVTIWRLEGEREGIRQAWQGQVEPLHIYPEHRPESCEPVENLESYAATYWASYLEVQTNGELKGPLRAGG